jgi:hypothetical protein
MTATSWPDLPNKAFVSGRLAQEADVNCGDAVFYTQIDGVPASRPAPIAIPQYAYLIAEDGSRVPVVVVQAEANDRATILGLRDMQGNEYAVTEAEVILLGQTHP